MHQIFSVLVIFCLTLGSVSAAADKHSAPLQWSTEPVVYDPAVSPLLQERHSVRNIMIAASLGSLVQECKVDFSQIRAETLLQNVASSVRGSLGVYLRASASNYYKANKARPELITFIERSMQTDTQIPASEKSRALLWECVGDYCPIQRIKHPGARSFFEDTVIDAIGGRYTGICTFFGSEFLAQEAVILQRLHAAGKNVQQVILIDTMYKSTIKFLLQCDADHKDDHKIDISSDKSLYARLHNRNMYNRLPSTLCMCCNDIESPILDLSNACLVASTLDQFKDYASTLFPAMKMRMYSDAQTYIQDCKKEQALRSDLLVGGELIDITDPSCEGRWHDFHAVQNNCLQISAVSALLSITKQRAFLHSYLTGVGQKRWTYDSVQQEWRKMDEAEFDERCRQAAENATQYTY